MNVVLVQAVVAIVVACFIPTEAIAAKKRSIASRTEFSAYMNAAELGTDLIVYLTEAKKASGKNIKIIGKLGATPRSPRKAHTKKVCELIGSKKFLNRLSEVETSCGYNFETIKLYSSFSLQETSIQINATKSASAILKSLKTAVDHCKKTDKFVEKLRKATKPFNVPDLSAKKKLIINRTVESGGYRTFKKIDDSIDIFYEPRVTKTFKTFLKKCNTSITSIQITATHLNFNKNGFSIYLFEDAEKVIKEFTERGEACETAFSSLAKFNQDHAIPNGYLFHLDTKKLIRGFIKIEDFNAWLEFFTKANTFKDLETKLNEAANKERKKRATVKLDGLDSESSYVVVHLSSRRSSAFGRTLEILAFAGTFPVLQIIMEEQTPENFKPITLQVHQTPRIPDQIN